MNGWMKKTIVCLMMMLVPLGAAHAQTLSVRRADGVGSVVCAWEKSSGHHVLFLPAYMQGQPLEIICDQRVRLGEMLLENGAVTDAVEDGVSLSLLNGVQVDVMASEILPAVHVATQSGSLEYIHKKKGNQETGHMQIITAAGEVVCDAPLDSIKGHGNATFVYEKKSYQVKLEDKQAFLGMDEGKRFVLLANQHENSLLRNRITFDLARALDLPHTPECASVDLFVNGEYRGSYLLCDKVTIASSSVDVTESEDLLEAANEAFIERGGEIQPYGANEYRKGSHKGALWPREPEDVTGGFLFELEYQERYADEASGVVTPKGQPVVVKEPELMSAAQGAYVYSLLESFERAVFSPDGTDVITGRHYTEIADFDSLVAKYMIEEVSRNYDGNKSSQYFFKDSDGIDTMLYAGPVWDYDSAWGNFAKQGYMELAEPTGLSVARQGVDYSWWPALYKQKDFAAEVRRVYDRRLRPMLEVLVGERARQADDVVQPLDVYAAQLHASAQMNFARWRVLNHKTRAVKTGATYEENIAYLRTWICERMAYLDKTW